MSDARRGGPAPVPGFMPQLDGLRAFAVGAVLVHHLLDTSILAEAPFALSWGLLGVRLFFVLSGFLITGIVLRGRDAVAASATRRNEVLRQFYLRRALRIFPLYYLVLALALLFGDAQAREQLPWLGTYTYNFWISALGWFPPYFSHFWSLCVEEQFYLVWPLVVLLVPPRRLVAVVAAMIAAAPLFRLLAWHAEFNEVAFYTLTPSSLDSLGFGALLAAVRHAGRGAGDCERLLRYTALPLGLAGLALVAGHPGLFGVLGETTVALVFVWLVAGAGAGFGGLARRILEAPPILYLGKISYGVYVCHLLVPDVIAPALRAAGVQLAPKGLPEFAVHVGVTVAAASLSWALLEGPINRLKRRIGAGA